MRAAALLNCEIHYNMYRIIYIIVKIFPLLNLIPNVAPLYSYNFDKKELEFTLYGAVSSKVASFIDKCCFFYFKDFLLHIPKF